MFTKLIFDPYSEELLAYLSLFPFEAFEELDNTIHAYILNKELTSLVVSDINILCKKYNVSFTSVDVEDVNWNATWEANFRPVIVRDFCTVKASFHTEIPDTKYTINIDPKMAFGTGHHETTYMMISEMEEIDFYDKRVLDYGCGTGILSILAEQLNAKSIDAIDIEEQAIENTIENISLNKCNIIKAHLGTIDIIDIAMYDIVLANINRHVLLSSVQKLVGILGNDGILLLSGILISDIPVIQEAYKKYFKIEIINKRGEWSCLKMIKIL